MYCLPPPPLFSQFFKAFIHFKTYEIFLQGAIIIWERKKYIFLLQGVVLWHKFNQYWSYQAGPRGVYSIPYPHFLYLISFLKFLSGAGTRFTPLAQIFFFFKFWAKLVPLPFPFSLFSLFSLFSFFFPLFFLFYPFFLILQTLNSLRWAELSKIILPLGSNF